MEIADLSAAFVIQAEHIAALKRAVGLDAEVDDSQPIIRHDRTLTWRGIVIPLTVREQDLMGKMLAQPHHFPIVADAANTGAIKRFKRKLRGFNADELAGSIINHHSRFGITPP